MKTKIKMTAIALVIPFVISGCRRDQPALTDRQVEQVFDSQQKVVDQQAALSQGRDDLETDRRLWSERERSDPIVAESIEAAGVLLACVSPLAVIALLLFRTKVEQIEDAKADPLLVEMLATDVKQLPGQLAGQTQVNFPRH